MFSSVHLTLLQTYHFPEPIFYRARLRPSWWQRLRHKRRDYQLFDHPPALAEWIRHGHVLTVPTLGKMKPLRQPVFGDDPFYRPFFQRWEARSTGPALRDYPLPFFPLQVLLTPAEVQVRCNDEDRQHLERLLGTPLRSWSLAPMLIIYPAGCISAQYRLYLEPATPLTADMLLRFLDRWVELPWQMQFGGDINQQVAGAGPAQLLDRLADRLRAVLLGYPWPDPAAERDPVEFTLINVQGSLRDAATGNRQRGVRTAVTRLAGVDRNLRQPGAFAAWDDDLQRPWLLAGNRRAVLAADDAVVARQAARRLRGPLLEARRALRNRAISTIEMALASRLIFGAYETWLERQVQKWTLEPLQPRAVRLRNFYQQVKLDGTIFGTLAYELAAIEPNLNKADLRNAPLWSQLYLHVMRRAGAPVAAVQPAGTVATVQKLVEDLRILYDVHRQRSEMQTRSLFDGVELLGNLATLLGAAPAGAPAQP